MYLMPEDAYTSTPGTGLSDDDLNSEDEFEGPNDDDKAGKKEMYGTEAKKKQVRSQQYHKSRI
jgi:hypothetical protein